MAPEAATTTGSRTQGGHGRKGPVAPRRILEVSLGMFNSFGEPNVTTNAIADEMNISPAISTTTTQQGRDRRKIFAQFERELDELFAMGRMDRPANVEDTWFWLHLLFEKIWKYRFIYRDLNDLLSKNRIIETHFKTILQNAQKNTERLMNEMRSINQLKATDGEIRAVATNLVMLATYWHSYSYVMNRASSTKPGNGAWRVPGDGAAAPYLVGDARALFERLAAGTAESITQKQTGRTMAKRRLDRIPRTTTARSSMTAPHSRKKLGTPVQGDAEPFPTDKAVEEAWRLYITRRFSGGL